MFYDIFLANSKKYDIFAKNNNFKSYYRLDANIIELI